MSTASCGVVCQNDLTLFPLLEVLDLEGDSVLHTAQVDRHVGCIGHQAAEGVEECTREVKSLLDVRAGGGSLQSNAHLLGNGHEPVSKNRQLDGVKGYLVDGLVTLEVSCTLRVKESDLDVAISVNLGLAEGLDEDCACLIEKDSWSWHLHIGLEVLQVVNF